MEPILQEGIEAYLEAHLVPRDKLLERLEREAEAEGWPIVGPLEGTLLALLVGLVRPKRILELGTAIGYSTTWLARGFDKAEVTTVEVDGSTAERARKNLKEAGVSSRVEVVEGNALAVVKRLKGPFAFIFNDIDKEGYPKVLPELKRLLPPGGLLVTDNVLWSGRVTGRTSDPSTAAIQRYNRTLADDADFLTSILPLRDGVALAWKRP